MDSHTASLPRREIDRFDYDRDANGNPTHIRQTRGTTVTDKAYLYNTRDWLTAYCLGTTACPAATTPTGTPAPTGTELYTYDQNGNRLTRTTTGTLTPAPTGPLPLPAPSATLYTYDAGDQLTTARTGTATTSHTYDADGNQTTAGSTWNTIDQLTGTGAGANRTTYTYDALGNRRSETLPAQNNTPTRLSWDINQSLPQLAVITNPDSTHDVQRYNPDTTILSTRRGSGPTAQTFYTHDVLGSIIDTVNADGTQSARNDYDPWGNKTASGSNQGKFGFTGGYDPSQGGRVHLGARDYDPATGRFTSTDPMTSSRTEPSATTYGYAGNNPGLHTDPSGMCFGPDSLCHAASSAVHAVEDGADAVGDATTAAGNFAGNVATDVWDNTTNHLSGCADRDKSDCAGLFFDLATLGTAEQVVKDASGCADHDKSDCGLLWVDLFTLGIGVKVPCGSTADSAATTLERDTAETLAETLTATLDATTADATTDLIEQAKQAAAKTGCFTAGTRILLADGTSKPIEDIKVGDRVVATSPNTGYEKAETVARTFVHHDIATWEVVVGGKTVTTTAEHPFWIDGQGWTAVDQLQRGDQLTQPDGTTIAIDSIRATGRTATVYNFEVDGLHDYYVRAGDDWILVHNNCRGMWTLTKDGSSKLVRGGPFKTTFYKSTSDGTWWTKDVSLHGGSAFKVYRETATGLDWIADADKFGDYIVGKWKGGTGRFIGWDSLSGVG